MSTVPTRLKRVLIVEDNSDNRALVSKVLRRAGFDTVECDRAEGLAELLAASCPDVVLMDIELPGQSGYEAVQQVRSNAATTATPVIALTAYAMQDDRRRCLQVGFTDYLSKPLDIHMLVQMVRHYAAP